MHDKVISVDFTIERNRSVNLSVNEYLKLMQEAKEYRVGYGKKAVFFSIVHTSAGYINLDVRNEIPIASWIADNFVVTKIVANDNGAHYAEISYNDKVIRVPLEGFLPNKIAETLFAKGIGISGSGVQALSMHLQWLFGKFEVEDARQVLGWQLNKGELKWCGSNSDPPLLKYQLSFPSVENYLQKLNELIFDVPPT